MKKFFRKLTKTQWIVLCFIPFGVCGFYFNGVRGFVGSVVGWLFGWWLGSVLYNWKESKRHVIKFLRRLTHFQLRLLCQSVICLPVAATCVYYHGWKGLIAAIIGWCIGEMISRRLFK